MARPRNVIESVNGDSDIEDQTTADDPVSEPSGNQIPLTCPECNGPLYEIKPGQLAHFQCFVGHRFSPEGLSEQHAEALERALWTAVRKLKERTMLHKKLIERQRNKGEERLKKWLEELCHHGRARSEAGARSSGADLTTAADEA